MPTKHLEAPTASAPPLTAKLAPWMQRLLKQPQMVANWTDKFGSPLHVVVKSEFERNAADLLAPLKERGLEGGLYFARKANKLPWFVSAANEIGLGVDTASESEVRETLALGVPGDKIVVTAIGKTAALVALAIKENCLLIIDNDDELDLIASVADSVGKDARVGLRFSRFVVTSRTIFSRFGFPVERAGELFDTVARFPALRLEVLHAHVDRYDTVERAQAGRTLVALSERAARSGHKITGIDLGGGIAIRYLDSGSQWQEFQQALQESVLGKRKSFTYLEDGLGYMRSGDTLLGKPDLYPAWNDYSKERFVEAVLDNNEGGTPFHRELSERGLKLYFEPGRALLDNTGMTFASVAFRKLDTLGNQLVGVRMNRFNLRPFRAEFCCDPVIITDGTAREPLRDGAFVVGCLCSESDTIFRRKIALPFLPKAGDIMAFPNSAGYMAHHLEVGTHGDPLPANLLIEAENWQIQASLSANAPEAKQ